jgi:putative DNA methylase
MPRHLLSLGLIRSFLPDAKNAVLFGGVLDFSSKLCRWTTSKTRVAKDGSGKQVGGASNGAANVFYNQALNTFFNFGCRATSQLLTVFFKNLKNYPLEGLSKVECQSAPDTEIENDLYITDPPYGDAVNYHEILEFFIAWLRKNPPAEFADWIWDSRRSLAIKGEGEDFRRGMVAAYRRMAEQMPDNGIQIIMFTHQSGSIWADMANIVWASGLQVTAAWYVATETDSALREGSYVKGTVLLVVRKQAGSLKTTRDDLAWEIQEEVEEQVKTLTGLNQEAKGLYRDENLFEDVDLQIAGYAAALRALTRYASIDGKDMAQEAIRPRVKGQKTLVDELIEFAVGVANQCLVPRGIEKAYWDKLVPAERFYLKLIDMESRGASTLDNYQNFAKAFKVKNFRALMASQRANAARLKSPEEFGRAEMAEGSELYNTTLRGVLYALMELAKDKDGHEVLAHLAFNVPNYYDGFERHSIVELASYLAEKLDAIRPKEASAARVLRDLVRHQQL